MGLPFLTRSAAAGFGPYATVCVKKLPHSENSSDISLSSSLWPRENASVVVQCPTCQSKFRIADEKVTDRGVRVRCTSCKNVFQVRKPGAGAADQTPGPGSTMDLSALGAAAVAKSGSTGPVKTGSTGPVKTGSTGPVKTGSTGPIKAGAAARPSTGPVKPSTGPVKPSTGPVRPSTDKVRG